MSEHLIASWTGKLLLSGLHHFSKTFRYVSGLSPKKQDKALISARRAKNIRTVLLDRKATGIESAQFRYGPWRV